MSPEVVGEANLASKPLPQIGQKWGGAGRSDLPHLAFLLGMLYTLLLYSSGTCDSTVPEGVIGSKGLPGLCVNGEVFEIDF